MEAENGSALLISISISIPSRDNLPQKRCERNNNNRTENYFIYNCFHQNQFFLLS